MQPREPKFIYFDLGNVLLWFDHRRAARQMAAVSGIQEDRAWESVFVADLEHQFEAGQISGRQFYDRFCETTNSQPDYQALLHAASDIFELNPHIVPVVMHLSRARYRLGILSNTNASHWQLVIDGRFTLINRFFPVTALSYRLRVMKPAPEIYAAAAAMAAVAPEEIFYTDDRPDNVAGAIAAGYDAVLFQDVRQLARELRRRGVQWNY
jgi:putative hydrolase of the HAD superfamily